MIFLEKNIKKLKPREKKVLPIITKQFLIRNPRMRKERVAYEKNICRTTNDDCDDGNDRL